LEFVFSQIFERIFPNIRRYFKNGSDIKHFSKFVYIDRGEMEISNEINKVFKNFNNKKVEN